MVPAQTKPLPNPPFAEMLTGGDRAVRDSPNCSRSVRLLEGAAMKRRELVVIALVTLATPVAAATAQSFVNFESGRVRPLAIAGDLLLPSIRPTTASRSPSSTDCRRRHRSD